MDASKRTTRTKTFRLDEKLIEKLPSLARKYGQSENQFVSKWLAWRVVIDPLVPTFDGITLAKETFGSILGLVNIDSMDILAWELGKKHFMTSKTLFESIGEQMTFVRYLSEILSDHGGWFRIEGNVGLNSKEITLHHDFKVQWSLFLKNYLSGAYEVVSRDKLAIEIRDSFVRVVFPDKLRF